MESLKETRVENIYILCISLRSSRVLKLCKVVAFKRSWLKVFQNLGAATRKAKSVRLSVLETSREFLIFYRILEADVEVDKIMFVRNGVCV